MYTQSRTRGPGLAVPDARSRTRRSRRTNCSHTGAHAQSQAGPLGALSLTLRFTAREPEEASCIAVRALTHAERQPLAVAHSAL
eukprot:6176842-Pleurochrysis_carterae.AAC.5